MPDFSTLAPDQSGPTMPAPGEASFQQLAPFQDNLAAADKALKLTPEETNLYKMHLANLLGPGGVDHPPSQQYPQGARSSLFQSVQEGPGGRYYNIPTVWDGKIETQPYKMPDGTTIPVANATALANVAKTGWNKFPSYGTPDEADARYDAMHQFMDRDTSQYLAGRKP